jgi:hypothetical protein
VSPAHCRRSASTIRGPVANLDIRPDNCDGWAVDHLTPPLLGRHVRIRSTERAPGEYLAMLLGGAARPVDGDHPPLDLRLAPADSPADVNVWIDDWPGGTVPVTRAPSRALAHMNRWLCYKPGPLVAVHAGAVARDGEVVVLIGESGAGKSTLVAGLTRAGWTYVSDEAAGIDPNGNVHPYARPIMLRPGSWAAFPELAGRLPAGHRRFATDEWHVPAELLGRVAEDPVPPAAVIEIRYEEGERAALRSIGRGEALERMAAHGCNLNYFGQDGLERLARAVRRSECYRLVFSDLTDAVTTLDRLG